MDVFSKGIEVISKIGIALGIFFLIWGAIHLWEGYGGDNPAARSQGLKQFIAGAGIVVVATVLIPMLSGTLNI